MKANRFPSFATAMLCIAMFFSCTTDIAPPPPPPDELSSSSPTEHGTSSAVEQSNYCVYAAMQKCFDAGSQTTCPAGGELSIFCPYTNSNSSSSGNVNGSSGSSSSEKQEEYAYCVFAAESRCLFGQTSSCPSGGTLSNSCPYSSSSAVPSSNSTVPSSSSALLPSSSSAVPGSSSSGAVPFSSSAGSKTRCKDSQNRELFCNWTSGCYAIDPAYADTPGQTCEALVKECQTYGTLYAGSSVEGNGVKCVKPSSSSIAKSSSSVAVLSSSSKPSSSSIQSGIIYGEPLVYEGETYPTVVIGSQTWMAKNLNYNINGSKCCFDNESNCAIFGRLYNWTQAMSACPPGWHLPSDVEWSALINAVGGISTAGTKLKAKSGWYDNGRGTDNYGFSALPGGYGTSSGDFGYNGSAGYWWRATQYDASNASVLEMYYNIEYVYGYKENMSNLYSVRCVRDQG